jgi:monothiol glutaredoxin
VTGRLDALARRACSTRLLDALDRAAPPGQITAMRDEVRQKIQQTVSENKVVLFMKGTRNFPQCGFSARVVQLLKGTGEPFVDVNVLSDPELREGIKEFTSWPTIPQLYVRGKFVGGCDIVSELAQSGELGKLLEG